MRGHRASYKQTPGGLRKTDEAKTFRRKLLRRPIALRGNTEYLQPNTLGKVILRYLEDVDDPIVNELREMVHARRWQTKDGTYRLKMRALPDVRDAPLGYDNAAASSTDANPKWRNWDEDYAMGYQLHP